LEGFSRGEVGAGQISPIWPSRRPPDLEKLFQNEKTAKKLSRAKTTKTLYKKTMGKLPDSCFRTKIYIYICMEGE